jgi:spore coat polysaccharide biosynthesis protein SpsF (cytidylyltransferase family)
MFIGVKNKVVVIIQARMGSSRFPGKMMEKLNGHTLMEWVIHRTKKAKNVDEVVLATSKKAIDDILEKVAIENNCQVFRGSESDVLGRYAETSIKYEADVVVRICADRPLVDPMLIDQAIDVFNRSSADLVYNHISSKDQWWPRGFGAEVLSAKELINLDNNVTDGYEREHVTLHMWNNTSRYELLVAQCPDDINPGIKDLKLDVDQITDLNLLKKVMKNLSIDSKTSEVIASWRLL